MKLNFRKISALASSALMLGMTAGIAAAANYPAPFVVGGSPNVAIVYGSGAAFSDQTAAQSIATSLSGFVTGGGGTVSGGESFQFEKSSTKYHLGDNITTVYSSNIDDDELPALLADGVFIDDNNDEFDFTQKIVVGATLQLGMFEDNDYAEDEPTIGFRIPSSTTVLTYTLDFTDEPYIADTVTQDLTMMGKSYYVLSNSSSGNNKILTLLDSAEDTTLVEGSSATVAGHSVSIDFISSTEVVLMVDGKATNSLGEGDTQKLPDGSYVGIKDIRFNSKDTGISSVEFSIGTGKLKLTSGSDIEINDETVNGLAATITNDSTGSKLSSIALAWSADDDLFITPTSEITMPGFGAVKLSFAGLTYPSEETVEVGQGATLYATLQDFPLKDTTEDVDFLYGTTAGSFAGIGKDSDSLLRTAATASNVSFDGDTDDWFVASWSDGSDAESYLMRAANFGLSGTDNITDLQYRKDGAWVTFKEDAKDTDTVSLGNVDLSVWEVNRVGKSVKIQNESANVNFNTLYTKEGLKVYLPTEVNTSASTGTPGGINFTANGQLAAQSLGHNGTSFFLHMVEEDKDENKASGDYINATLAWTGGTDNEVTVSDINTKNADATSTEIQDTDVFRDFTYSALATEILWDKPTADADSVKLIYHGSEVTAAVYITSPDASVVGGALGDVLVTDSEVSSVKSKNLVVVGGSCINSAAAALVGGAYCTSAWTTNTGVGAGQFLIKGYSSSSITTRMALLVAGYEAADTTNAATYLRTQSVDTSKTYKGTSATQATLVVS